LAVSLSICAAMAGSTVAAGPGGVWLAVGDCVDVLAGA